MRLPRPLGIVVDARGVHRATRVPAAHCGASAQGELAAPTKALTAGTGGAGTGRGGAAAETAPRPRLPTTERPTDPPGERHARNAPVLGFASGGRSALSVLLMLLVIVSVTLLWLAAVKPRYVTMRFRLVRVLAGHREEVAVTGVVFLAAAGLLFVLARLP